MGAFGTQLMKKKVGKKKIYLSKIEYDLPTRKHDYYVIDAGTTWEKSKELGRYKYKREALSSYKKHIKRLMR